MRGKFVRTFLIVNLVLLIVATLATVVCSVYMEAYPHLIPKSIFPF